MLVPRILLMTMRYLKLNSSFKTRKKILIYGKKLEREIEADRPKKDPRGYIPAYTIKTGKPVGGELSSQTGNGLLPN